MYMYMYAFRASVARRRRVLSMDASVLSVAECCNRETGGGHFVLRMPRTRELLLETAPACTIFECARND